MTDFVVSRKMDVFFLFEMTDLISIFLAQISERMSRIWRHVMNDFPVALHIVVDQLKPYMKYLYLPIALDPS